MVRISVDLPDRVADALGRAAVERQSTREAVLVEAALAFLAADDAFAVFCADRKAFAAWVAEGEADVAAGRVHSAEDVFAELDAIIGAAHQRRSD
jgi:predicted transcriptional regulator